MDLILCQITKAFFFIKNFRDINIKNKVATNTSIFETLVRGDLIIEFENFMYFNP